eukprot:8847758-Pyramimonas_sp.AAC.1
MALRSASAGQLGLANQCGLAPDGTIARQVGKLHIPAVADGCPPAGGLQAAPMRPLLRPTLPRRGAATQWLR